MRTVNLLLAGTATLLLSACGSHTSGFGEGIRIDTSPRMAAYCVVENARETTNVYVTPSVVDVARANGPLKVSCQTRDGWHGQSQVASSLEPMAAAGVVVAATAVTAATAVMAPHATVLALAAAGTGAAVGSATVDGVVGAAFHYPQSIVVPMVPSIDKPADAVTSAVAPAPPVPAAVPVPPAVRHVVRHPVHHAAPAALPCTCTPPAR